MDIFASGRRLAKSCPKGGIWAALLALAARWQTAFAHYQAADLGMLSLNLV
jgi:hypothetical protein